ncbi:DUF4163 domain-containing protein [Chryseobacterium phocaeense]|uniref:DUF4163 domain-containing protein n=1 Tax=Chryseobacterium phocaeense TaxID=1816690 RepID=UPI001E4903E4|nr:DUF4163 domain-containing protein [Chryseobacterium phocaeense]
MKKIVFFLLISGLSFSQQKNVKITNLLPESGDTVFPVVTSSGNPLVGKKINAFLQVDQLEFVPESGGNPFKKVSAGNTSYSSYVHFYSWEKMDSPKNILSITMEGEASGAYPESFFIARNFDLRTGNYINVQDLFKPDALKVIQDLIKKEIRKQVADFLAILKAEKNPSNEVLGQIGLYEGCYTDYGLDSMEYYFGNGKLKFIAPRCANHAMRALDELDSHVVEFHYQTLEKYWSPYAKNLVSGSEQTDQTSVRNKLYKGKIDGKYPVTVLIKRLYDEKDGEASFSASYWYDKNKKLIEWNGNIKGNHISATESEYYSEEARQWMVTGLVEADINGKKITGTWQDYKTKKYLNLELEEL